MFRLILLCFGLRLCIRKFYCVLENIVVHQEISLCSGKDCCVPESIIVFSKRLLCSEKDCCVVQKIVVVSEQKLSCVLPLWATVEHGSWRSEKAKYMLINERLSCSCDRFWKPSSTIQETTEYMVQVIVIWSGSVDYSGIY